MFHVLTCFEIGGTSWPIRQSVCVETDTLIELPDVFVVIHN